MSSLLEHANKLDFSRWCASAANHKMNLLSDMKNYGVNLFKNASNYTNQSWNNIFNFNAVNNMNKKRHYGLPRPSMEKTVSNYRKFVKLLPSEDVLGLNNIVCHHS